MIRLNKLLAERGLGARRKCDTLIAEGRVRVNGERVSEAGTKVEEGRDRVEVDGRLLPAKSPLRYFVLNKPVGVITTLHDPEGRRTVATMLPPGARTYPVGRLDADTSGLLLLTNDGELAHRLMHPRYGVEKVYRVRLSREPSPRRLEQLARGVEYEPGVTSAPARVRRIDPKFDAIMIEIAVHEGRYRQVRRMCEALGLEVTGLHRVAYGPVRLGPLARGMWRELSNEEVARLRGASSRPVGRRPSRPSRPSPEFPGRKPPTERSGGPVTRGARRPDETLDDDAFELEERRWGTRIADEDEGAAWPKRIDLGRGDADFRASKPAGRAPSEAGAARPTRRTRADDGGARVPPAAGRPRRDGSGVSASGASGRPRRDGGGEAAARPGARARRDEISGRVSSAAARPRRDKSGGRGPRPSRSARAGEGEIRGPRSARGGERAVRGPRLSRGPRGGGEGAARARPQMGGRSSRGGPRSRDMFGPSSGGPRGRSARAAGAPAVRRGGSPTERPSRGRAKGPAASRMSGVSRRPAIRSRRPKR